MNQFEHEKKTFLNKIDKSKKGGIDRGVKELVNLINKSPDYFTKSSCSGRIMLLELENDEKKGSSWLYSTHEKANLNDMKSALNKTRGYDVWFRQDSMIIHTTCREYEHAKTLLDTAQKAGFKRAGIISAKKHFVVEIFNTEKINTIIARKKEILINEEYMKTLVEEANRKMQLNKNKIKKLVSALKKEIK